MTFYIFGSASTHKASSRRKRFPLACAQFGVGWCPVLGMAVIAGLGLLAARGQLRAHPLALLQHLA